MFRCTEVCFTEISSRLKILPVRPATENMGHEWLLNLHNPDGFAMQDYVFYFSNPSEAELMVCNPVGWLHPGTHAPDARRSGRSGLRRASCHNWCLVSSSTFSVFIGLVNSASPYPIQIWSAKKITAACTPRTHRFLVVVMGLPGEWPFGTLLGRRNSRIAAG